MIQFIEQTILNWLVIFGMMRLLGNQKLRLRKAALYSSLAAFFIWLYSLGVFLQNGAFEMSAFFMTGCIIAAVLCAVELIYTQVGALKGVDNHLEKTSLVRALRWINTIYCTASIILVVLWIVFCRTGYRNSVVLAMFASMIFANILYILEMVHYATRILAVVYKLQHNLGDENRDPDQVRMWTDLCRRLSRLRIALIAILFLMLSTLIPLVLVHVFLGSVPYGFVLVFFILHSPSSLCCAIALLALKSPASSGQHATSYQKEDRVVPFGETSNKSTPAEASSLHYSSARLGEIQAHPL